MFDKKRNSHPIAHHSNDCKPRIKSPIYDYAILEPRQLLAALANSLDGMWTKLDSSVLEMHQGEPLISLKQINLYDLNEGAISETLQKAPLEFTPGYQDHAVTITVPNPNGKLAQFRVVESPIMEPELAAQFPDFKTYRGNGIDDPAATIRFDVTIHGFRAQVLSPDGNYYVDPYYKGQTEFYSSYSRSDVNLEDGDAGCGCGVCVACEGKVELKGVEEDSVPIRHNFGGTLRTFRLANAATGEYTAFWGGSVAQGQAAIVTAVNRVTGIYENDLAIRLVLVANNSSLVYTNASTDPYTNSSGSTMLGQNQATIDSVIGNANYDIGHVFSTGGGGIAGLGVVGLTGNKARGVTGLSSPTGDPFYVDYVAHEMGHQFGGSHTFNGPGGSCGGNRSSSSAYEPGSGTSIMAYAGICGADNVQSFSDPFFHSRSIDQIRALITGTAAGVGVNTATGNNVPTVSTATGFVIPARTPFELTATGTDADTNNVLTYSWEQRNLGSSVSLIAADNGASPLFRSYTPSIDSTRVFPRLSNLLDNTVPTGEKLPTTNWSSMNFRVVVRDNSSGGGGVNWANMSMQVVNTGTPFQVTSQNSASSWIGGSTQNISWNVAGTTASPINQSLVDIWLSTDGGNTFSTLLASATPNDGSQQITVPNVSTGLARIKVKGTNNVFFDINNVNFTISPVATITNQYVYYLGSSYSSGGVEAALDTSKVLAKETNSPQTLGYSNLINTTRGINGLVFDVDFLASNSLNASDFEFRWSPQGGFDATLSPNQPGNWDLVSAAPSAIDISTLGGNSKRIRLEWGDNQIENRWLSVTLHANANTGLLEDNVFYVGHLHGETSGLQTGNATAQPHLRFFVTNLNDVIAIRSNLSATAVVVTNPYDLNKNGVVQNLGDVTGARSALSNQLTNIQIQSSSAKFEGRGLDFGGRLARAVGAWTYSPLVYESRPSITRSRLDNWTRKLDSVSFDSAVPFDRQDAQVSELATRIETIIEPKDGPTITSIRSDKTNQKLDLVFASIEMVEDDFQFDI